MSSWSWHLVVDTKKRVKWFSDLEIVHLEVFDWYADKTLPPGSVTVDGKKYSFPPKIQERLLQAVCFVCVQPHPNFLCVDLAFWMKGDYEVQYTNRAKHPLYERERAEPSRLVKYAIYMVFEGDGDKFRHAAFYLGRGLFVQKWDTSLNLHFSDLNTVIASTCARNPVLYRLKKQKKPPCIKQ